MGVAGGCLHGVGEAVGEPAIEQQGYRIVANVGDQESDLEGGHADRAGGSADRSHPLEDGHGVGQRAVGEQDHELVPPDAGQDVGLPQRALPETGEGGQSKVLVRAASLGPGSRVMVTHLPNAVDGLKVQEIGDAQGLTQAGAPARVEAQP